MRFMFMCVRVFFFVVRDLRFFSQAREVLTKCAGTALNSKLISSQKGLFAPMVVEAISNLDQQLLDLSLVSGSLFTHTGREIMVYICSRPILRTSVFFVVVFGGLMSCVHGVVCSLALLNLLLVALGRFTSCAHGVVCTRGNARADTRAVGFHCRT